MARLAFLFQRCASSCQTLAIFRNRASECEGRAKGCEARRANPVALTKKQRAKLLQVFHPDTGATVTKK
jgi:hypothetical protein